MAARSLFIVAIIAALAVMTMAAPASATEVAQISVVKTTEVSLKTNQVSASKTVQSSAKASASGKASDPKIAIKASVYSTQGLPASIFPTNSYSFSDSKPLDDGLETLSLQPVATDSS